MTRRLISLAAFALLAGGSASSAADPALPGKSVQENSPREISSPGKPPASKNSFGIKPEGITSPAMQAALERLHRAGVVPARRGTLTFFRWTESEPPRLAHLGLWGEAIDNELFALAADLPDLEHVSLYETNVNDDGLAVLSRFTKLRTFSVLPIARYEKAGFGPPQWSYPFMAVRGDRPRVTGRVLEALRPSSAALQRLDLLDAAVSHSDLAGLAEFPRLSSLSLPGPIDDETVRRLQACPRLNSLTLGERAVTAAELRALSAWKSLRTLTLVHATLSDDALTALAELQTLQELTLNDCGLTDERLQRLRPTPKLSSISFARNEINGPGLAFLKPLKLKTLGLEFNNISDATLPHLTQLESVEKLSLSYCRNVTDHGLRSDVFQRMPQLKQLGLRGLRGVTDAALDDLIKLSQLEHLTIRETAISPQGVARLKAELPQTTVFK